MIERAMCSGRTDYKDARRRRRLMNYLPARPPVIGGEATILPVDR